MLCLCLSCDVAIHSYTQACRVMKREKKLKGTGFSLNIEHSVSRFYSVLIYILGKMKKIPVQHRLYRDFLIWFRR